MVEKPDKTPVGLTAQAVQPVKAPTEEKAQKAEAGQIFRDPLAPGGANPSTAAQRLARAVTEREKARAEQITAQHDARQTVYRPHGDNDAYREAKAEVTAAKQKADQWKEEIKQLSGDPTLAERAKNTIFGGVGKSFAADVNTAASAYELTQGARNSMMSDYLAEYEHGLNRAKNDLRQLEESGASAWDVEQQRMIANDWQRKVDAITEAVTAQPKATQATYGLADDIKSSAETAIENAKRGLDNFGKLVVDVGAKVTQMGTDWLKSGYLLNQFDLDPKPWLGIDAKEATIREDLMDMTKRLPLAVRTYGENTQIARQEGADTKHAALYGATTAITDAEIERVFDGLSKFYGKSIEGKTVQEFAKKIRVGKAAQRIINAGINDFGESLESLATNMADQLLKSAYNGKSSRQNKTETEWDRVGRNVLIDAIISLLSGDAVWDSKQK